MAPEVSRDSARPPVAAAPPPLVSVVMNGRDSARYLREALASVRAQTHANWELIFWDSASEDDSEAIVRTFADSRVRFLSGPRNATLAAARNRAMAQARGTWIAFLDCDDLWLPTKLERQLERAGEAPAEDIGLVYARTESFSARGSEGETTWQYEGRRLPEGEIAVPLLREGNLVPIVSALLRRDAVAAVGPIPEHLTFAEDYWLFTAIAERYTVRCVQDVLCRYRVHSASATYRNKLASHREALQILEAFGHLLPARSLARRRAVYHTLIAIERARGGEGFLAAAQQVLSAGSVRFLLAGSVRYAIRRALRRRRPYA